MAKQKAKLKKVKQDPIIEPSEDDEVDETVQNVVFKESFRAKIVNEDGFYPKSSNDDPNTIQKFARENRDGEIELIWTDPTGVNQDDIKIIDSIALDEYLANRLNLDIEYYEESGEQVFVDLEELDDNVYKISVAAGDYITLSFDDLAAIDSY